VVSYPSGFDLAVTAYKELCSNDSTLFRQPIEEYSGQINNVVYLRTGSVGYVARFDVRRHRLLV